MAAYAVEASFGKISIRDRDKRLDYYANNVGKWCARALKVMNVDVQLIGYKPELFEKNNYLLVGNHLSYIDIFIIASTVPVLFVTSVEMAETPFLGQMAEMGGSIFVERRSRAKVARDLDVMATTLKAGHNVVIFPEGTSSSGDKVLPFKKSLLMSAVSAQKDVMPIVIRYTEMDGKPLDQITRDRICWYTDVGFGPHFVNLMSMKSLKVELHFLDPIPVSADTDRRVLSETLYKSISETYGNPFGAPRPTEETQG